MSSHVDNVLCMFILDYYKKRGLDEAASALRSDLERKGQSPTALPNALDSPKGLLSEWFEVFWDYFRERARRNYGDELPHQLGNGARGAGDTANIARSSLGFDFNALQPNRQPPTPVAPSAVQAQSPASMITRAGNNVAIAGGARNNATNIGAMQNQIPAFSMDSGHGRGPQASGMIDMNEAFGSIMSGGSTGAQRHSVPGMDISRIDLQGASAGNSINRHLRQNNPQQMRNMQGQMSMGQAALGNTSAVNLAKARHPEKRPQSASDMFAPRARRSSADSTSPMQQVLSGSAEGDSVARSQMQSLRTTSSTMNAKKRENSSGNVAESIPSGTQGLAVMGSSAKGVGGGAKKRMRTSSPYPTNMPMNIGMTGVSMQSQHQGLQPMHQAQHQAHLRQQNQQAQQLVRGTVLQGQSLNQVEQQRMQVGVGPSDSFPQLPESTAQEHQDPHRGFKQETSWRHQPLLHHQGRPHQLQQKVLGNQDSAGLQSQDLASQPGQDQNLKYSQQTQNPGTGSQRQNSQKVPLQHQQPVLPNGKQDGHQFGKQRLGLQTVNSVGDMTGSGIHGALIDEFNPNVGSQSRLHQNDLVGDASAHGHNNPQASSGALGSDPLALLMPVDSSLLAIQNSNQAGQGNARQSTNARQRTAVSSRSKGAPSARPSSGDAGGSSNIDRAAGNNPVGSVKNGTKSPKEGRRGGSVNMNFSRPMDRSNFEGATQRMNASGSNVNPPSRSRNPGLEGTDTDLIQNSKLFGANHGEMDPPPPGNGPRDITSSLKAATSMQLYTQQSTSGRQGNRKGSSAAVSGNLSMGISGPEQISDENISIKSDKQESTGPGGGTSSQRSYASGASGGVDRRTKTGGSSRRPRARGGGRKSRGEKNSIVNTSPVPAITKKTGPGASTDQILFPGSNDRGTGSIVGSDSRIGVDATSATPPSASKSSPKGRDRSSAGGNSKPSDQRQTSGNLPAIGSQSGRPAPTQSKKRAPGKNSQARQQQNQQASQLPQQHKTHPSAHSHQVRPNPQHPSISNQQKHQHPSAHVQKNQRHTGQPANVDGLGQQKGIKTQRPAVGANAPSFGGQESQSTSRALRDGHHSSQMELDSRITKSQRQQGSTPQSQGVRKELLKTDLKAGSRSGDQGGFEGAIDKGGDGVDHATGKDQPPFGNVSQGSIFDMLGNEGGTNRSSVGENALELDKAFSDPSLLMPESNATGNGQGSLGYAPNIPYLPDVDDADDAVGIPSMLDINNINAMNSNLGLEENNAFTEEGGILEGGDPNGVILR